VPLAGLRVLDFTRVWAGPLATRILADLGAEVIKVENPQGGDMSRQAGPFIAGEGAGFLAINRNKKSLTLNLKSPKGKEIFSALVRTADVLIENFRPGTMRDLGLDYETLAAINPRLIYSSASGFGQTGPYAMYPAQDLIAQGLSGLMSITGEPGRPPVKVGVPIADLTTALFGAYAILAALYVRDRTGRGQHIDVNLLESALALEVWETSTYFATGEIPEPLGSAHRTAAPYQAVRTADGYINIAATSPRNWSAFCQALGLEHLEHDERYATVSERRKRYQELAAIIEEITVTRPSDYWLDRLMSLGVPCGRINNIEQIVNDPHIRARGFVVELAHPTIGKVRATGSPVRLSATPTQVERAGPLLGEHTAELLAELGYSEADLRELSAAQVI
jgi:crotonobetainyl-CoA:carnitine CoA-transferase CaiB-like acyl-CoA transferase